MFGKKQPTPPWYIQILTRDLSVEGFADPDHIRLPNTPLNKPTGWQYSSVTLTQPRLVATGPFKLPVTTGITFATALDKIVIYIPRDAASQANVTEQMRSDNAGLQAICFVGPYTVSGRLYPKADYLMFDTYCMVRDAQITCPGNVSSWPGVSVPIALLHPTWLQGYLAL